MIAGLLNKNGGVGKTTLAQHLAAALAEDNRRVLLIDADPHGSALGWEAARDAAAPFTIVGKPKASLHRDISSLAGHYDDVIDGPPRVDDITRSVLLACELVAIPVQCRLRRKRRPGPDRPGDGARQPGRLGDSCAYARHPETRGESSFMKKVSITNKPDRSHKATTEAAAEAWVAERQADGDEPTKRLTIDVPFSLHRRMKAQCALDGVNMADVVREFLDERFGAAAQD